MRQVRPDLKKQQQQQRGHLLQALPPQQRPLQALLPQQRPQQQSRAQFQREHQELLPLLLH
jgi:hypothetical protein